MKYFIGFFVFFLILGATILGILALWGIYPVSEILIWKSLLTLFLASVGLTLLSMAVATFFKREKYDKTGNNAHPMRK